MGHNYAGNFPDGGDVTVAAGHPGGHGGVDNVGNKSGVGDTKNAKSIFLKKRSIF